MLVQHNLRIISKYYGRVTLTRVGQLVGVDKTFSEQEFCELNNLKLISCRIDRIDDTVDFRPIEN
jgi:26S proteasome regulatory subunit N5